MNGPSVQEQYAPENPCFGCGPANAQGLRIRSFREGGELAAEWKASPHHEAFPGVVNGGIVGTLLDCHSNWCAAMHLMEKQGAEVPPCTVTAEYAIRLLAPTPSGEPLRLRARVVESTDRKAVVEATLESGNAVTASCHDFFWTKPWLRRSQAGT